MSETPQTPPPVEPPPSGSGGTSGRAAGGYNADQMKSAVQGANPYDLGIIAAGVLAFIFSLFAYYTISVNVSGLGAGSDSASAWHGFFGWFAALLAVAASAVLAATLFAKVKLPFPVRLSVLIAYGVALLCVILALFIIPGKVDCNGISQCEDAYDYGHGVGYWISLIVILVGTVLAFLRKDAEE
jgi:hypothetical protein